MPFFLRLRLFTNIIFKYLKLCLIYKIIMSNVYNYSKSNAERRIKLEMLRVVANTLGLKNPYTEKHSESMVNLSVLTGEKLGLSGIGLENLKYGTLLHDIGKIATPDAILNKPGKLTDEEFAEIKKHPIVGYELLSSVSEEIADIVRHHHEHVDGSGYPDGLRENAIGIAAKIVAVVDVFDALINVRPYKQAFTKEKALEIIISNERLHFDKDVVESFVNLI